MLDSLEIRNFKNLKEFRIDRLERVNLFTGRNNTGKSTILEAVGLYATKCDLNFLYQLLNERGESYSSAGKNQRTPDQSFKILSSLFTNRSVSFKLVDAISIGSLENTLFGESLSRIDSIRLRFVRYYDETVEEAGINPSIDILSKRIVINDELDEKYIDYSYNIGMEVTIGANSYVRPVMRIITPLSGRGIKNEGNVQFIKSSIVENKTNGDLWDNITLSPKENYIIEALRIIDPKVERIAFVNEGPKERNAVIKLSGTNNVLPLKSMGDGINRILTIILALVNADNGYLLIDEFENGLHYSVQEKLWEIIFALSQKLNIQVFATTHSSDCINAFEDVLNANAGNEGKLIRLDNKDGVIKQVEYDAGELRIASEYQIETR